MIERFELYDIIEMKKPHACGANEWTIIRTGADIKIKCNACARIIMLDRQDFIKKSKKLLLSNADERANKK